MDASVRVWDAVSGACVHVLAAHTAMVYALQWSPDASLLASGGFDRAVHVWDARAGVLVRSYKSGAGVLDVAWRAGAEGAEVAVGAADGVTALFKV